MKTSTILFMAIAALGFTAFTVNSTVTPTNGTSKEIIHWTGSKLAGDHTGTLQIKESSVMVTSGKLTGGTVVVDMKSMINTDLEGEWNAKLIGHLHSEDFFSTDKYPTSTLKITKVSASKKANTYNVIADLTIKGITKSENFEVTLKDEGSSYIITSHVKIDRTKYDVRYGSSSFFDDLGDKAISNEFSLNVTLHSAK